MIMYGFIFTGVYNEEHLGLKLRGTVTYLVGSINYGSLKIFSSCLSVCLYFLLLPKDFWKGSLPIVFYLP